MGQDLGFKNLPDFEKKIVITQNHRDKGDINAQRELRDLQESFESEIDLFAKDNDKRYLALIKGLGIAADVAASAVAKKEKFNYSLPKFIKESFEYGLKETDFIPIIGDKTPYLFQEKVADSKAYFTFAQAGCGSGKSLAAYLWAKKWCKRFSDNGKTDLDYFFVCQQQERQLNILRSMHLIRRSTKNVRTFSFALFS